MEQVGDGERLIRCGQRAGLQKDAQTDWIGVEAVQVPQLLQQAQRGPPPGLGHSAENPLQQLRV